MAGTSDPNDEAFKSMQPELARKHPHEVAIFQKGRLVAIGKDYGEAMDRAFSNPASDKSERFLLRRVGPYDEEVVCLL